MNWIRFGHAAKVAREGFRVIMPDLRAHGQSDAPHDPALYPPDILTDDNLALVEHLGLTDYDLGGYSLGARTVVRIVVRGAAPGPLIVSGMGLQGLHSTGTRADHFKAILTGLGTHERGSPEWLAEAFLKTTGGDRKGVMHLLDSFVDTPEAEIATIAIPTLVLSGDEDSDNGSPRALAGLLPNGEFRTVPGGHMSAVIKPELGQAMADFLAR
jgi:pimeloyl-ACP methyl ester carboxylesterase